jgi:hypothetical protein
VKETEAYMVMIDVNEVERLRRHAASGIGLSEEVEKLLGTLGLIAQTAPDEKTKQLARTAIQKYRFRK